MSNTNDTVTVRLQVVGERNDVEFAQGATAQTVYNYVAEQTKLALNQVRVLVNSETVEPEDSENVVLKTGDLVDVVPEINNG